MKTNPNDKAYPVSEVTGYCPGYDEYGRELYAEQLAPTGGLTKREIFAMKAMSSCILKWNDGGDAHSVMAAKQAVIYADALIAALNEEQK